MTVTIYDVAKHAGVSVATVSRVINNANGVKTVTKAKVLLAIQALNYQYNQSAGSLATGKTGAIGLLVPNISNPFYSQVADGVYSEAAAKGIDVITFNFLGQDEPNFHFLSKRSVDGLLAMDLSKSVVPRLTAVVDNLVLIGNDFLDGKTSCVITDNYSATRLLMDHLMEAGHRNIALLTEPPLYNDINDRIRAYNDAMDSARLQTLKHVRYSSGADIEAGEQIGREWAASGLEHSAIFVSNDMLAIGLIKAFKNAGLRVPEDVSVAGFDGTWVASIVDPPLTTVCQPMYEMGSVAVDLLMDLLKADNPSPRKVVLSPFLRTGGTVSTVLQASGVSR